MFITFDGVRLICRKYMTSSTNHVALCGLKPMCTDGGEIKDKGRKILVFLIHQRLILISHDSKVLKKKKETFFSSFFHFYSCNTKSNLYKIKIKVSPFDHIIQVIYKHYHRLQSNNKI